MTADDRPPPIPAKPYADDLAELPPWPIDGRASRGHRRPDPTGLLSGAVWLLAGMAISGLMLGIPGCAAPAVTAKADVSVRETALIARAGSPGGVDRASIGGGSSNGELTASLSVNLSWPAK